MRWYNPWERKSEQPSAKIFNDNILKYFQKGFSGRISPQEAYNLYNQNPVLSDAVDMISSKFSSLIPVVQTDSREIISKNKVLEFLKNPNNVEDYNDFATGLSSNYLLNNNAYVEALGFIKGKPSELYNVRNTALSITESSNSALYLVTAVNFFQFLSGTFKLDSKVGRILDESNLKELYHLKGFYFSNETLRSVSRVMSLQKELGIIDKSAIRNLSILKKGFSAAGVMSADTDDEDSIEQLRKDVKARYSGAGNAGEILVTKGKDVSFKGLDMTNKDLEGLENKKESKSTVYERYDIPSALRDKSAQTFNNYQTALYALYDNAVFPLADKIFGKLTTIFRQRNMLKDNERITYDIGSINTLQLRRFEEIKSAKESGVLTIDELRSLAGYEELSSGGNDVYIPQNFIPVGQDADTSNNLTKPTKKFTDLMMKNGASHTEITKYWNEYQTRIKKD